MNTKSFKYILLSLAAMLFLPFASQAQDDIFVITLKSGERVAFATSQKPRVEHNANSITVVAGVEKLEYPIQNVSRYTIETDGENTAIESLVAESASISNAEGRILLSGFTPSAPVAVYAIDGKMVTRKNVGAQGTLELPLSSYTSGTYVVKVQGQTFKFMKR